MAKIIKVYDPEETERRITLSIQNDFCPDLLEFLSSLKYGTETALLRGIIYQWFISHRQAMSLTNAVSNVMEGPGGLPDRKRSGRISQASIKPAEYATATGSASSKKTEFQPEINVIPPLENLMINSESTSIVSPHIDGAVLEMSANDLKDLLALF